MDSDAFVAAVRTGGELESVEHAERAVTATLTVLGQRLAGGEPGELAAQLPAGVADALPDQGAGERFELTEFYERVAAAENDGCNATQSRRHARAVIAAAKVAVSGGELEDLLAQLPDDYADLFALEPVIHY